MTTAPAGWYPDPGNGAQQRYWDGQRWTDHVAPAAAPAWPSAVPPRPQLPQYANFGQRVGATLIDLLVLFVPIIAVIIGAIVLLAGATATSVETLDGSTTVNGAAAFGIIFAFFAPFALLTVGSWLYYVGFEGGRHGQTIGKWMMGIRVLDARTAEPPTLGKAFLRHVVRSFASGQILALGYLWMLWDDESRTWHDMAAETRVVEAGPQKVQFREFLRSWTLSRRAGG